MLPQAYQLPAAYAILAGGTIACFAGYRLFRIVLGVYGFILGALIASSMMGAGNTTGMVLAALAGGLLGAVILVFGYFLGVALVGAGLGAVVAHTAWSMAGKEPGAVAVIAFALAGAFGAMLLQRYVIIIGTAFGGAWTMLVAGLAVMGDGRAMSAARTGQVWVLYPLDPAPGQKWVPVAWIVLGILGTIVQFSLTAQKRKKKG
ncbi:MAG TPA: DUF4203 domain-containing protein [Vicinamibacterales bacterium]|nr:DUF4203 domain-containing protein [Vicinamibacterales bacterium]